MRALGTLRLSTDPARDDGRSRAVLERAVELGVPWIDTARAYGLAEGDEGHGERLVGAVLGGSVATKVSTKGGMVRAGAQWRPDGRAGALRADCERSLEALRRSKHDLYLVHAVDPKVPWATTLRALTKLHADGLAARIGVCNVTRAQLEQALAEAPISAIQVAVSPLELDAWRGGVVALALERGLEVFAHSPLGGHRRREKLQQVPALRSLDADVPGLVLQVLEARGLVPVVGATRAETVDALMAPRPPVSDEVVAQVLPLPRRAVAAVGAPEVRLVMGLPGAGKSTIAGELEAAGWLRLNRDREGGTLEALNEKLGAALREGARHVVLDNTYLTRAQRQAVVAIAAAAGANVVAQWLELPVPVAQARVVRRMLEVHGRLLEPNELARGKANDAMGPQGFSRMLRALEPLADDEGFTAVERMAAPERPREGVAASFVELEAEPEPLAGPTFVLAWRPGAEPAAIEREARAKHGAAVVTLVCTHPGGAPSCWCRPPLPGLAVLAERTHGICLTQSRFRGRVATMGALAAAVGAVRST